jgi:hypothetical protein
MPTSEVARAVRDGHWGWFAAGLALMGAAVVLGGLRGGCSLKVCR